MVVYTNHLVFTRWAVYIHDGSGMCKFGLWADLGMLIEVAIPNKSQMRAVITEPSISPGPTTMPAPSTVLPKPRTMSPETLITQPAVR